MGEGFEIFFFRIRRAVVQGEWLWTVWDCNCKMMVLVDGMASAVLLTNARVWRLIDWTVKSDGDLSP